MLKDFIWETFKTTGNIQLYIIYKEVSTVLKNLNLKKMGIRKYNN